MTIRLEARVNEAPRTSPAFVQTVPAHERWARLVAAAASRDDSELDRTIAMIADLIRLRMIDDPYAAARTIRTFKIGRDAVHDDAIEAIAVTVRIEASATR